MAEYVVVDKEQLEADLTTVAGVIREKFELTEKLKFPDGMTEAVDSFALDEELTTQDELIEQIKTALAGKAGVSAKNTAIYDYGTSISSLFNGATFPDGYVLDINVPNVLSTSNANYFAMESNVEKIILSGNVNNIPLNYAYFANNCTSLKEADFSNWNLNILECGYMFGNCYNLKKIVGEFDFSNCARITFPFNTCNKLEELRLKRECLFLSISIPSSVLSDESIQSIIDGLADLTDTDTQTLTLHADVKAKLTEEQISTITDKNWTLA